MLKKDFIADIDKKYQEIKLPNITNHDQFGQIEFRLSYVELGTLLNQIKESNLNEEVNIETLKPIIQFLQQRWERIKDTPYSYPYNSNNQLNAFILSLANKIMEAIPNLNNGGRYQLMMPTVSVPYNEMTDTNFSDPDLKLEQFIISEDGTRFIEIADCIDYYATTGNFIQCSTNKNEQIQLTQREKKQVVQHSPITMECYKIASNIHKIKQNGGSIGLFLENLAMALYRGSVEGRGKEMEAGSEANIAIAQFSEVITSLTKEDKEKLFSYKVSMFSKEITFGELWRRLSPDAHADRDHYIHCVQEISAAIYKLLDAHPNLYEWIPNNTAIQGKNLLEAMYIELEIILKTMRAEYNQDKITPRFLIPNHDWLPNFKNKISNLLMLLDIPSNDLSVLAKNFLTNQRQNVSIVSHSNVLQDLVRIIETLSLDNKVELILNIMRRQGGTDTVDLFLQSLADLDLRKISLVIPYLQDNEIRSLIEKIPVNWQVNDRFSLVHIVEKVKDPNLIDKILTKINYQEMYEVMNEEPHKAIVVDDLLCILAALTKKQQNDFINLFGPAKLSTYVQASYPAILTSNFREALQRLSELHSFDLNEFQDERTPDDIKLKSKKNYEAFIKLMLITYLEIRDQGKDYKHVWGSVFGGVTKSEKKAAVETLLNVIDGHANIEELKVHHKALNQGDLGAVYKLWNNAYQIFNNRPQPPVSTVS